MIDYLRGFAIVTAFFLLGTELHSWGFPIPGGVLGLLLFFLALTLGVVKLRWVERTADLLLRNMILLFVPYTIGILDMGPLLSKQWLALTASLLVSLVAVVLTTGLLGEWLLRSVPLDEAAEAGNRAAAQPNEAAQ
jgi:holin-like protein